MISFRKDKVIYIPVDFNMFYIDAQEKMDDVKYAQEYIASEEFVDEMVRCVAGNPDLTVLVDLRNIVVFPARAFVKFEKYLDRLYFCNVAEGAMFNRIGHELSNLIKVRDKGLLCIETQRENAERIAKETENIRNERLYDIIRNLMIPKSDEDIYLESSGLYTNYYVDIKRLFTNVEQLYFAVFSLANKMSGSIRKVDAIVSSGKNGAILASILAGLFDIKEVHIIGVGPKYAMNIGDSIGCIKEGKRYAFVFDFMCTGTELKIVSALVNSKKGILNYAAGIAKFRDDTGSSVLNNLDVLASMKDLAIDYNVFGQKGE